MGHFIGKTYKHRLHLKGEKQFSGVWKGRKSRESKICSWFVGLPSLPCLGAPSLHVQGMPRNSTELWFLEDEE